MRRLLKCTCKKCGKVKYHKYAKRIFCSRSCKSSYENTGKRHPQWKGKEVGYNTIHRWVQRYFGHPRQCTECNIDGKLNASGKWSIDWSNISGKYKRVKNDWRGLCRRCHYHNDQGQKKATVYVGNNKVELERMLQRLSTTGDCQHIETDL